ncbi:hypothetical protein [Rhodoplanes roseus]|uniref:Uncharacterized protein n=1 Tax=Rhodoplanes roseus TaxID=29409 RepID=A0A327KQ03_9BRAD|nr:hypothetical protein [Rhodoplanes roseus]RAI40970.1 hypothetical protein CH341_22680 [Rhodoplanes roseus]
MTDRRHAASGDDQPGPTPRLGAADRSLIRAVAIDLMMHLARTLPPQTRRPRRTRRDNGST